DQQVQVAADRIAGDVLVGLPVVRTGRYQGVPVDPVEILVDDRDGTQVVEDDMEASTGRDDAARLQPVRRPGRQQVPYRRLAHQAELVGGHCGRSSTGPVNRAPLAPAGYVL